MFRRMMAAVDLTDSARDVVALARLLPGTEAPLLLANVYDAPSRPSRAANLDYDRVARTDALEFLAALRAEAAPGARIVVAADQVAANGVHRLAARERVDGLVVGATSHRGRLAAGGITREIVHHAPCPIAVAPRGFASRAWRLDTIGVGVDGSALARHALIAAAGLAELARAKLRVVGAVARDERLGRQRLARLCDELGIAAAIDVGIGDPAEVLARETAELDLLVLGRHDRGAIGSSLYGSVSRQVLRDADTPLLIVGQRLPRELVERAAAARGDHLMPLAG